MIPLLIIGGLFAVYEVLRLQMAQNGGTSGTGGSGVSGYSESVSNATGADPAKNAEWQGVQASNQALNFIPVVGPALSAVASAITSALKGASMKRAKEAVSENQAVVAGVQGWDAAVAAIAKGYNNGDLTGDNVLGMLASPQTQRVGLTSGASGLLWSNYWSEVSPQIQPGRNGCKSGTVAHDPKVSMCGGKVYGAACCVGYDNLDNSQLYLAQAVVMAEQTGKGTGNVVQVFASKYGGVNRSAYTVTFTRPNAITSTTKSFLQTIGL